MSKMLLPPSVGGAVRTLDWLVGNTVMRLAAGGGFFEASQQTHAWNNYTVLLDDIEVLNKKYFVTEPGCSTSARMSMWRAHCPILGGWRRYVVLWQKEDVPWRVGWCGDTFAGVSSIVLRQAYVRLLVGPDETSWFALRDADGEQLPLSLQGRGVIGDGRRPWGHITLL